MINEEELRANLQKASKSGQIYMESKMMQEFDSLYQHMIEHAQITGEFTYDVNTISTELTSCLKRNGLQVNNITCGLNEEITRISWGFD